MAVDPPAAASEEADEWPTTSGRVGATIAGRYQLLSLIGHGGMGSVYFARHVAIGKPLAVKILDARYTAEQHGVERLFREARAAAAIGHPNIVDVADVGIAPDGSPYLVMEFLEGEDLSSLLARVGPVSLAAACGLLAPILEALAAAHDMQIVHRDLKPGNIFVLRKGGRSRVKLIDFGIAKRVGGSEQAPITMGGALLGTPSYMSPEQAKGSSSVDARADLYAVGVVFYQLLTGRLPFDGSNYNETLYKIVNDDAALDSTLELLPAEALALIRKAIAKDPLDRYQTAHDMLDAFAALPGWLERRQALQELDVRVSSRPALANEQSASAPSTVVSPVHTPEVTPEPVHVLAPTLVEGSDEAREHRKPEASGAPGTRRSGSPEPHPAVATPHTPVQQSEASAVTALADASLAPPQAVSAGARLRTASALTVAVVAIVALFGLSRRDSPQSPTSPPLLASSATATAAPTGSVRLTLSGAPTGARVWFDDLEVFDNPFVVPLRDELVRLRVEKDGYEAFQTEVVPSRDSTIRVAMLPLPPAPAETRTAASRGRPKPETAASTPAASTPAPGPSLRQTGRGALYSEEFE